MHLLVTDTNNNKKGRAICLMPHDTSPSHILDQAVDCGLWNVVLLLFNCCVKLLDIGRNCNTLSYTCLVSMQAMEELEYMRYETVHYHAEI